jgi:type II secretory pathway pseudopilin PulG
LRKEGIRYLESMAGYLWTDYNTHDPGITILEQLCYALTDLAYRIDYALPDLLAEAGEEPYASLYSPAQILTSQPVTLSDLRKLVIDVEGVKNAWIEKYQEPSLTIHREDNEPISNSDAPHDGEPVLLKGRYRVLIEKSDLSEFDSSKLKEKVAQQLHACRSLCENFQEIRVLEKQDIQVHAHIEIGSVDDVEQVLLHIYQRIADYVSPSVRFHTLREMLATGKRIEEVFEGPRLEHGFIDTKELQRSERKTELRTSDLIREIMDVTGVRAVRALQLVATGEEEDWLLRLDKSKTPKFDLHYSKINLEKDQLSVSFNKTGVLQQYNALLSRSPGYRKLAAAERDLQPPPGRDRNIGRYYSIQQQFPDVYGVSGNGLPNTANSQRKAQAKQLKAYLMFFDQLLANYFAQLSHAGELFSFYPTTDSTYFSNMLDDPELGLDAIRNHDASRLQEITENPYDDSETSKTQQSGERKNRFLNHLLARFAEQFTDYAMVLHGLQQPQDISVEEKLIQDKQAFLQNYPWISSARGTAFNYLKPEGEENRSGLEQRIRLKLGITETEEDFYLVEHILLRPIEAEELKQTLLEKAYAKDPYSLQLSLVFPKWPVRFSNDHFRYFVENTVREETPAHLTAYIHWLEKKAMGDFKQAYKNWLQTLRKRRVV